MDVRFLPKLNVKITVRPVRLPIPAEWFPSYSSGWTPEARERSEAMARRFQREDMLDAGYPSFVARHRLIAIINQWAF